MQPHIYIRAFSPFRATLLNLLLASLLHSCSTNRPSRELNPFPNHMHLYKRCLTRTMVASLTSHSKPKGDGCLQWPQRDLPAIKQLSSEFNIQDRGKIFHGLQLLKNCFWLHNAQLSACTPLELPLLCWRLQIAQGDLTLTCSHRQAMPNLTGIPCLFAEARNPSRRARQTF